MQWILDFRTLILLLTAFTVFNQPRVQAEVDTSPISVVVERAYSKLRLRRPVLFENAGDGSNRVFVASQQGVIHVLPNDPSATDTQVFLDVEDRVVYKDNENEEGLLGLAFHPNFKTNGEFFLYYTTRSAPHTSVVSRFRVSKSDPGKADAASEEELLRIMQPFWNHNGGTLAFGPDGFLYIALGDGGSADDPHNNGQNLETLLGSILRIDVNKKEGDLGYAIPKDNPFVGRKDARPEIWVYGLRNVWRMSFDRQAGTLWAADVGQNIWEEINLIERGGNYGWKLREAKHKFGSQGSEARTDLIDPIWEYHHDVGKSITGGNVYRGKRVPELVGAYLYADYVSGKVWALRYDQKAKQVVGNHPIGADESCPVKNIPVMTFGEDEAGEVHFCDSFGYLYRFRSTAK